MTTDGAAGASRDNRRPAPWWEHGRLAAGDHFREFLHGERTPESPEFAATFMARDALALAADVLQLTPDDQVYLPAYLCKEVLRPFVGKARIRFYDVEGDLSIDPDRLMSGIRGERVRLVVVINYFGQLQPHRRELLNMCAERGALLLEDCAHSLLTEGSGETGDLTVVSYRKLLPVWDGGGLTIRHGVRVAPVRFRRRLASDALSLMAQAKSALRFRSQFLSRAGVADLQESLTEGSQSPRPAALPMSRLTQKRLSRVSALGIIERRRQDYEWWSRIVSQTGSLRPLLRPLEAGVCPLGFPVYGDDRDALQRSLQSKGVPATVHWRLSQTVGSDCPSSHAVSSRVVTLPVFPELTAAMKQRVEDAGRLDQ